MNSTTNTDSEILIRAENICLPDVLDNVTLTLKRGDFITLVGPNGAGKTMLLRCLLRLATPTSGKITTAPKINIGYVPQILEQTQIMPLSVLRFLSLNQDCSQATRDEIMEETNITGLAKSPLNILSRGELQRVLLARALARNPDILMLDEPAQNLDINGQLHFYNLIDEVYNRRNIAILMVSHDLHLVMASTHKVICLFKHICCEGEVQDVKNDPAFKSIFGDDMAQLMSVYSHSHSHTHEPPSGDAPT